MIALDTETNGMDFYHGCRPFLVTTCTPDHKHPEGINSWLEWEVDPLTRKPTVPPEDMSWIGDILRRSEKLILHNTRFDFAAIQTLSSREIRMPWEKVEDTLIAGHVLWSNDPHNLTDMGVKYLGYRKMQDYETRLEEACKKARDYARRKLPHWQLAKHGRKDMPSCKKGGGKDKRGQTKDSAWKNDMWLLKALEKEGHCKEYWDDWAGENGNGLTADYANMDSSVTLRLWPVLLDLLNRQGLYPHYREQMRLLPVGAKLERHGVILSAERLEQQVQKFAKGVSDTTEICCRIAHELGYRRLNKKGVWEEGLKLSKNGGNNQSLSRFVFGQAIVYCQTCQVRMELHYDNIEQSKQYQAQGRQCANCKAKKRPVPGKPVVVEYRNLDLPVVAKTKSGAPAISKEAIEIWRHTDLSETQRQFVEAVAALRGQAKAIEALNRYRAFWLPIGPPDKRGRRLWMLIHPNLNQTGSDTLRWSSRNPNLQNISKQKDYNLRYVFGPAPGREHWSLDYKNIELRIPAYESGQKELIALFEQPDAPPFYGSEHLLNFSVVYPDLWLRELPEQVRNPDHIKTKFKGDWYQYIKNTDFALQYNCGRKKADATAHKEGAYDLLKSRFVLKTKLNDYWVAYAEKHGYIETLPDRTVCPERGYPLQCTRTENNRILNTVPLAYHVSGTAMWISRRAMVECQAQLDVWNREAGKEDYRMVLQVHDELFFDFPKKENPKTNPRRSNLMRARILQRIMEQCGTNLICRNMDKQVVHLPTPVGIEYHDVSWNVGIAV